MSWLDRLLGRTEKRDNDIQRVFPDWSMFDSIVPLLNTTYPHTEEKVDPTFTGYVTQLYLRNSVVFACLALRARLFSEARFQFQQMRNGRPGQLFGTPALSVLEHPEPGKITGDMLAAAILDADLAGNAFLLGRPDRIRRLRPDWVWIIYGSKNETDLGTWDPDAEAIGYVYHPGGMGSGDKPITFDASEVAHFAPNRHPLAHNLGISLMASGLREISADNAATSHKLQFFEHAATPNLSVKLPPTMSKEKAAEWMELFEQEHTGRFNAYRAIAFGGGVEPMPLGNTMQQMTFKELQGTAETRIAALTGMHPVIAALSEGLAGSSLNAGNFTSAARLVADATLRPLWRNMAGSLETLVKPLPRTRLWYDDRDISFLRSDIKDEATTIQTLGTTVNALIVNGWEAQSAVDFVSSGDLSRLVWTGLLSVQLQAPGSQLVPVRSYRVSEDFWPSEGVLANLGTVRAGTLMPIDHPLVNAFPSLIEPSDEEIAPVVAPLKVTRMAEDDAIRCSSCGRLWAEQVSGSYRFTCSRCKTVNEGRSQEKPNDLQRELLIALASRSTELTISEGAIQVHTPVTVSPSPVTFEENSIRTGDTHITTPDVRIEAPITVEPSTVMIESGAIQVAAPEVRVDAPITVEAAEAPRVEISEGAVRVNVEQSHIDDEVVEAIRSLEERLTRPRITDKSVVRDADGRLIGVRETEMVE